MDKVDKVLFEKIMNRQFSEEKSLIYLKELFDKYKSSTALINYYGCYLVDLGYYADGINVLKLNKKPKSELRVLAEYLAYANLGKVSKALKIMFNYLKDNKAVLLKDTLIELQNGLLEGYYENFADEIRYFSKTNNVEIKN